MKSNNVSTWITRYFSGNSLGQTSFRDDFWVRHLLLITHMPCQVWRIESFFVWTCNIDHGKLTLVWKRWLLFQYGHTWPISGIYLKFLEIDHSISSKWFRSILGDSLSSSSSLLSTRQQGTGEVDQKSTNSSGSNIEKSFNKRHPLNHPPKWHKTTTFLVFPPQFLKDDDGMSRALPTAPPSVSLNLETPPRSPRLASSPSHGVFGSR